MTPATISKVARVLDQVCPLDCISTAIALVEIAGGLSGATPFELLIVATAESALRAIQAEGRREDFDMVIEIARRRVRLTPPWNAEHWDAGFAAAFDDVILSWRRWRAQERP